MDYKNLERVDVQSSNLASVGWQDQILVVEFQSGLVYTYEDVSRDVFEELLEAESKGTYFHKHIRNEYEYQNIGPAT